MTCKDCYHYDACSRKNSSTPHHMGMYVEKNIEKICKLFKDKSTIIELPCKVGGEIFAVFDDFDDIPPFIDRGVVFAVGVDEKGTMWISVRYENGLRMYYTKDNFCKSTFPTREEAEAVEAALEGLKNG